MDDDLATYEARGPIPIAVGSVIDPEFAIGRDRELAEIVEAFSDGDSVALTGERRHGKTVVASLVEREPRKQGWTVVSRSVEGIPSVEELTRELAAALVAVLPKGMTRAKAWLAKHPELSGAGLTLSAIGPTLEDLAGEAAEGAHRLVLIIDELPICARALERTEPGSGLALLHRLRRMRQTHPNLRMVCLGSIGFHHVLRDLEGATNDLGPMPLRPLGPDAARELAVRLLLSVKSIPTAPRRAVSPQMARLSDGVPYYLHRLAADCRKLANRGEDLYPGVIADLIDLAIADPDDPWDLKHYVTRLPGYYGADAPAAGAILDLIAARPCSSEALRADRDLMAQIAATEVGGIVARLEQDHYVLAGPNQEFAFRSEIVRRGWLRWRR